MRSNEFYWLMFMSFAPKTSKNRRRLNARIILQTISLQLYWLSVFHLHTNTRKSFLCDNFDFWIHKLCVSVFNASKKGIARTNTHQTAHTHTRAKWKKTPIGKQIVFTMLLFVPSLCDWRRSKLLSVSAVHFTLDAQKISMCR